MGACRVVTFLHLLDSSLVRKIPAPLNALQEANRLEILMPRAHKLLIFFSTHTLAATRNVCSFNYFIHQTLSSLQLWTRLCFLAFAFIATSAMSGHTERNSGDIEWFIGPNGCRNFLVVFGGKVVRKLNEWLIKALSVLFALVARPLRRKFVI